LFNENYNECDTLLELENDKGINFYRGSLSNEKKFLTNNRNKIIEFLKTRKDSIKVMLIDKISSIIKTTK
jgi:hypothetical protein